MVISSVFVPSVFDTSSILPVYEPFSIVTGRITMKMQINPNQSGTHWRIGAPSSFIVIICVRLLFQPSCLLLNIAYLLAIDFPNLSVPGYVVVP